MIGKVQQRTLAAAQAGGPKQLQSLTEARLQEIDYRQLLDDALGLAKERLEDPRLQRMELTVSNGRPEMLAAFLDSMQTGSYMIRLSAEGNTTWQSLDQLPAPGPGRRLKVFHTLPRPTISPAQAFHAAVQAQPKSDQRILALGISDSGRAEYTAFNPSGWRENPAVAIDAKTGQTRAAD